MPLLGGTANRMTLVDSMGMEVIFGTTAVTTKGTLDGNGLASVTFMQAFDAEPGVAILSVGAKDVNKSVPNFDITFTRDADSKYIGCTVYGQRTRPLPSLSGILLIGPLVTALSGFNSAEPAAGAGFSLIAVKASVA